MELTGEMFTLCDCNGIGVECHYLFKFTFYNSIQLYSQKPY